jgi:hypothetical protein
VVPKMVHFYWGGGKLIYLRYLTIKSFMKHNPEWDVVFWYPKDNYKGKSWGINTNYQYLNERLCKDYLDEVMALPIKKVEVDFAGLGARYNLAEVHKNDYIRVSVLNLYGGAWSDLDIIYFKPLSDLKVNTVENKDKETYVCIGPYGHSTGFNMAMPESQFFGFLTNILNKEYHPKFYQCWGPDMMNKYYPKLKNIPNAVNLSMDVVYAHNAHNARELQLDVPKRFNDESVGCHWYAGNEIWGDFLNKTRGGEKNLPKCIIRDLIEQV